MASRVALLLVTLLLLGVLSIGPAEAKIGIDKSRIDLGKVPAGHSTVRFVNVTNTGEETIQVETRVECNCPTYVTATPASMALSKGETRQVRLDVDVADDANPGIHDYRVMFTEQVVTGGGGSAQGAIGLQLTFQVRAAGLYVTFQGSEGTTYDLAENGTLGFRFANGYENDLEVTVSGTVTFEEEGRDIGPVTFTARGGGERSAVTAGRIQTGLDDDAAPGVYTVALSASWRDPTTDATGTTPQRIVNITLGASAEIRDFAARVEGDRVVFTGTIANTGGTTLEARMVVEVRESGGPDVTRLESETVTIPVDGAEPVSVTWDDPRGARYSASAFAVFQSVGSAQQAEGPKTAERSFEVESDGSAGDDSPLLSDTTTTILVAAGVGLLVGGAIAMVALRRRP